MKRRTLLSLLASVGGFHLSSRASTAVHRPKVVVIGGGIAGTTFIRAFKSQIPNADIILIEKNSEYTCCFKSNEVIFGMRPHSDVTRSYTHLSGICKIVQGELINIEDKRVILKNGTHITFDYLVISTGVSFDWESIDGYRPGDELKAPHSWGGKQSLLSLTNLLTNLKKGGAMVITTPPGIYKCPPGPYERASLAAHFIKSRKLGGKVLICDSSKTFSKQSRFAKQWVELYGFGTKNSIIEWLPVHEGGALAHLDTRASHIKLQGGETIHYDVANVIPPQSAGDELATSGLIDGTGWCPIDGLTLESTLRKGVFVIGDCAAVGDMPKSAFSAIAQAHHCALNLAADILDLPLTVPRLMNVCYSLVQPNAAISIAHRFSYDQIAKRIVVENSEMTPLSANADALSWEAHQSENWFQLIASQAFGPHN